MGRKKDRVRAKSYLKMMTLAIEDSEHKMLKHHQICEWMSNKYPLYYKLGETRTSKTSWQEKVQDELYEHDRFIEADNKSKTKCGLVGNYWTLRMGYLTREMGVKRRGCLYNENFFDKTQNEESDDDLAESEYVPKEPKRRKLKSRQKKSSVFVSSSSSGTSSDELPINNDGDEDQTEIISISDDKFFPSIDNEDPAQSEVDSEALFGDITSNAPSPVSVDATPPPHDESDPIIQDDETDSPTESTIPEKISSPEVLVERSLQTEFVRSITLAEAQSLVNWGVCQPVTLDNSLVDGFDCIFCRVLSNSEQCLPTKEALVQHYKRHLNFGVCMFRCSMELENGERCPFVCTDSKQLEDHRKSEHSLLVALDDLDDELLTSFLTDKNVPGETVEDRNEKTSEEPIDLVEPELSPAPSPSDLPSLPVTDDGEVGQDKVSETESLASILSVPSDNSPSDEDYEEADENDDMEDFFVENDLFTVPRRLLEEERQFFAPSEGGTPKKPWYNLAALAGLAILNSHQKMLSVLDIVDFIKHTFSYYNQHKDGTTDLAEKVFAQVFGSTAFKTVDNKTDQITQNQLEVYWRLTNEKTKRDIPTKDMDFINGVARSHEMDIFLEKTKIFTLENFLEKVEEAYTEAGRKTDFILEARARWIWSNLKTPKKLWSDKIVKAMETVEDLFSLFKSKNASCLSWNEIWPAMKDKCKPSEDEVQRLKQHIVLQLDKNFVQEYANGRIRRSYNMSSNTITAKWSLPSMNSSIENDCQNPEQLSIDPKEVTTSLDTKPSFEEELQDDGTIAAWPDEFDQENIEEQEHMFFTEHTDELPMVLKMNMFSEYSLNFTYFDMYTIETTNIYCTKCETSFPNELQFFLHNLMHTCQFCILPKHDEDGKKVLNCPFKQHNQNLPIRTMAETREHMIEEHGVDLDLKKLSFECTECGETLLQGKDVGLLGRTAYWSQRFHQSRLVQDRIRYHWRKTFHDHYDKAHPKSRQCKVCQGMLPSLKDMTPHLIYHQFEFCDICAARVNPEPPLFEVTDRSYQQTCYRTGQRRHKNYQYQLMLNLEKHKTYFHTEGVERKQFQCKECTMIFESKSLMTTHINKKHKNSKYDRDIFNDNTIQGNEQDGFKCGICCKVFDKLELLKTHLRVVHEDSEHLKCKKCGEQFGNELTLKQHERSHEMEKLYACSACPKRFTNSSNRDKHYRSIHSNFKPYKCIVCEKGHSDASNLKKHIVVHTKEKPFQCEECEKLYYTSADYRSHLKDAHDIIKRGVLKPNVPLPERDELYKQSLAKFNIPMPKHKPKQVTKRLRYNQNHEDSDDAFSVEDNPVRLAKDRPKRKVKKSAAAILDEVTGDFLDESLFENSESVLPIEAPVDSQHPDIWLPPHFSPLIDDAVDNSPTNESPQRCELSDFEIDL